MTKYDGQNSFAPFTLAAGHTRVILDSGVKEEPVRSLVDISLDRDALSFDDFGRYSEFHIYVVNGRLEASGSLDDRGGRSQVTLKHPWARDLEGDGSYVAQFELARVQFASAWGNTYRFKGILRDSQFYDPDVLSPFHLGLERSETDPERGGDWDANSGYPYTPPKVSLKHYGLDGPALINIDVHFGGAHDGLAEWVETLRTPQ